jgi:hypothetical protein
MSAIHTSEISANQQPLSVLVRVARLGYFLSNVLFIAGIALQVFFAGATLLVNGSYLIQHRQFGEMLAAFPVIILVTAQVARLPRRLRLLSTLPLVLFILQYMFLYAVAGMGLPSSFRALHAVNALGLFWITQYLAKSAWRLLRQA